MPFSFELALSVKITDVTSRELIGNIVVLCNPDFLRVQTWIDPSFSVVNCWPAATTEYRSESALKSCESLSRGFDHDIHIRRLSLSAPPGTNLIAVACRLQQFGILYGGPWSILMRNPQTWARSTEREQLVPVFVLFVVLCVPRISLSRAWYRRHTCSW